MPLSASCPSCGKSLKAPDALAGKRIKCLGCGELFALPGAAVTPAGRPTPAARSSPEVPAGKGRSELAFRLGLASIAVGLVACLASLFPGAAGFCRVVGWLGLFLGGGAVVVALLYEECGFGFPLAGSVTSLLSLFLVSLALGTPPRASGEDGPPGGRRGGRGNMATGAAAPNGQAGGHGGRRGNGGNRRRPPRPTCPTRPVHGSRGAPARPAAVVRAWCRRAVAGGPRPGTGRPCPYRRGRCGGRRSASIGGGHKGKVGLWGWAATSGPPRGRGRSVPCRRIATPRAPRAGRRSHPLRELRVTSTSMARSGGGSTRRSSASCRARPWRWRSSNSCPTQAAPGPAAAERRRTARPQVPTSIPSCIE